MFWKKNGTKSRHNKAAHWCSDGDNFLLANQGNEAIDAFAQAVSLQPDNPQNWIGLGNSFQSVGNILARDSAHREALTLIAHDTADLNSLHHVIPEDIATKRGPQLLDWLLAPNDHSSVFIAALPKSGGRFLRDTLLLGLGYTPKTCSCELFPGDVLNWQRLPDFSAGGYVAHHHIPASATNLWLLKRFDIKPIVHFRDPRAAVYSWMHHIVAAKCPDDLPPANAYGPPSEYYQQTQTWRIDWLIENRLPQVCTWIAEWVQASDDNGFLITEYTEIPDIQSLCQKIATHLSIKGPTQYPELPKVKAHNFRSGDPKEWRNVFTAEQISRANTMVPKHLFERFGWEQ